MYMQLVREYFTPTSCEGLIFVNGTEECYSLEDTDRKLEEGGERIYGKTAIPRGKYNVIVTYSPRFKKRLPLLENVPQFEGIRIHVGNTSKNTEGCILVGASNVGNHDDFIGHSKMAFEAIMNKIEGALVNGEEVTMEVV